MESTNLPNPALAIAPLILVGVANFALTKWIPVWYGANYTVAPDVLPGVHAPIATAIKTVVAIWAVEGALLHGVLAREGTLRRRHARVHRGRAAPAMNTCPRRRDRRVAGLSRRFRCAQKSIPNPLVNAAISVSSLAGITGSASGDMSIALAAMSDTFIASAQAAHIPLEVLHRVVAMASGGMDTLPHNGAVITLLAVTGLTHRESYRDIFAVTVIKTLAVFFVIAVYYLTGIV